MMESGVTAARHSRIDDARLVRPRTVEIIAQYIEVGRGQRAVGVVREAAFRCILDLLGAAAAGLDDPATQATRSMARTAMGSGSSPIWFTGTTGSLLGAAWANSAAASALDLDDGHRLARGHPGAAVIPTAFAVAHAIGDATIEDILSSIVVGYEVGVSVASARTSYGSTGTWAPYAVVATAAALRRTPKDVIAHALAIAGESAPTQALLSAATTTSAPEGSDLKEGIPWAVVTGLAALGLAECGYTGPRNILDSDVHYRFPDHIQLGFALHICNVYFKLYACCRHVHAPLDALTQLIALHDIKAEEIEAIHVHTYSGALHLPNKTDPTNLVEIQYSIPYCLALAAIDRTESLLPLCSKALDRPEVVALAERIVLSLDSQFETCFPAQTLTRVEIACRAGTFMSAVTSPNGDATNPLSWEALERKLETETRLTLAGEERRRIIRAIREARNGNLAPLADCLAQSGVGSADHRRTTVIG